MKQFIFPAAISAVATIALTGCYGTQVIYVQETMTNESGEIVALTGAEQPQGQTVAVSYSNGTGNSGNLSSGGAQQNGNSGQKTSGVFDSLYAKANQSSYGKLTFVSSDVSDYPTVKLYYSYTDGSGTPIELTSPTAAIKETISGGAEVERTVKSIQKLEGNEGLSIDIVADKSGSMDADLYTMQNVMTEFVNHMDFNAGDQAELISFDSYIMYMCTYTKNPALLSNGISNMTPYGQTALYDALIAGINNAANQTGARCVIGFTDGADNVSYNSYGDVIRIANEKDVPVYIIGTGSAESYILTDICSQTGGYYWNINSIYDMSGIMSQIYSNSKAMYCIEYESDTSVDAYLSRSVQCVLSDNKYSCYSPSIAFTPVKALEKTKHDKRYEVIKEDITWTEANEKCLAMGGHLATITSQAEMDELAALVDAQDIKNAWIGGYTSVRNGAAFGHWITGEVFDFAKWYPGEPSRNDKDGTPEFYLVLWKVDGEWSINDERDDMATLSYLKGKCGYICEYEY